MCARSSRYRKGIGRAFKQIALIIVKITRALGNAKSLVKRIEVWSNYSKTRVSNSSIVR